MFANATGEMFRLAKSGVALAPSTVLDLPARLLDHIRRLRLSANARWMHNSSSENSFPFAHQPDLYSNGMLLSRSPPPPAFTTFPGPWGFLTSGYILGLFMMVRCGCKWCVLRLTWQQAILLHRIRNIVVPPRHPFINRFARIPRRVSSHIALPSIFPLDLSSSMCRLVLRSPTLYFVFRMLFVWIIVLAQAADQFPSWDLSLLQSVGTRVAQIETADICWYTFGAVCGVLAMEAITHGLEGGVHHPSPFNLVGLYSHLNNIELTYTNAYSLDMHISCISTPPP
jgi:hypothetical protein